MSRGVYVALSGAVAQEQALETTATNLANASTPGYQRMRPVFREALARATTTNNGKERLHYGAVAQTARDGSRGALRSTGRQLDIALPDKAYLATVTPNGERYTRAGSLTMGSDGILKTSSGTPVAREDGKPLQLSPTAGEPTINADGSVSQNGAVVAKLKIVRETEGTTLSPEGAGLLVARGGPLTVSNEPVEVGMLEESNATAVTAMTELVTASRTFEAFQRMLETFGECDRKVLTTTMGATE